MPDNNPSYRLNLEAAVQEVFQYASHVDDWVTIKKELLKVLHPAGRRAFSTRHKGTKKQRTNKLERDIAVRWSQLTGRPVIFRDDEPPPPPPPAAAAPP